MKKISIILALMLIIGTLTGCGGPTPEEMMGDPETREIKSCILDSSIETRAGGAFVLGVGTYTSSSSINTEYYVYVKGAEGYRLQEIDSNNLEIVETDDIKPCIKGYFSDEGKIYKSAYDIDEYYESSYSSSKFKKFLNYTIYVPTGTIKEQYSTDILQSN